MKVATDTHWAGCWLVPMSDWTVVATKKVLPAGNQALAAPTDNYELE